MPLTSLPKELLLEVCTHLSPNDTISLAETNQHTFSALSSPRNLFLKSPFCRLHLSQWNTWQAFAENYSDEETFSDLFKQVNLVKYTNQPLPHSFKALQGDLARQWNSEWNSCDRGIRGPREDGGDSEVLDLTSSEVSEEELLRDVSSDRSGKNIKESTTEPDYHRHLYTDHFEIGYKFTSSAEILLEWNMDSDSVTLYTIINDKRHTIVVDKKKGMKMHHLQLIDDIALVFVLDGDVQTTYYLVPGNDKLVAIDFGGCQVPQEGLMMYNGQFYKAVLDEKVDVQVDHVTRQMGNPTTITPGAAYEICQDLRFPRYGLVYTNMDKNLAHVIDLEKKEISQFLGLDKDVSIVGVSDGELAIWKYTREYLEEMCEKRGMEGFKEVVEKMFENNENWEEFHKELVDAWS